MTTVAIWRSVDIWPNQGFADGPWLPHPDDDAFVRSARRVWTLYSEALPALKLPMPTPHLRIGCLPRPAEHTFSGPDVTLRLDHLDKEEFQGALLRLPPGVDDLLPEARTMLALDVLTFAAERLADLAGWDPTVLAVPRQAVLDAGFEFRWHSPWKSSPNRRHKVRMAYRIHDDGIGRMRVEVSDGSTALTTAEGYCPPGYKYAASTVRWDGSDAVTFDVYDGRWNSRSGRAELCDLSLAEETESIVDLGADRPAVVRFVEPVSDRNRVRAGGGGLGYLAPLDLASVMDQHMRLLNADDWQAWWASADLGVLEVRYEVMDHVETRKILVRKTEGRVQAQVTVPYPPADQSVTSVGHEAVTALMEKVRARASLHPHPPIPRVDVDRAFVAEEQHRRQEQDRALAATDLQSIGSPERPPGVGAAPADRDAAGLTPSIWKQVDGTDEEPAPPIQFSGGTTLTGVPPLYSHAVERLLRALRSPEWESWWSGAALGPLRLSYVTMPWKDGARYQVQKRRGGIGATLRRPLPDIPDDADHAELAREDVAALMAKLQQRAGLGPYPPIPAIEIDWDHVRADEAADAAQIARLRDVDKADG